VILFAHSQKAAEADHRIHDVVGLLLEQYVFHFADALACGVLYVRSDHLLGANSGRVAQATQRPGSKEADALDSLCGKIPKANSYSGSRAGANAHFPTRLSLVCLQKSTR